MTIQPEIDLLLQQYWRDHGNREDLAYDLLANVTAAPPTDAVTAGRCAGILETLGTQPPQWAERIRQFNSNAARLIYRQHQVDILGDDSTDPDVVFEILDEEIPDLDMEAFDPAALRNARIGKPTRAAAARAFLDVLGWSNLTPAAAAELQDALDNLEARASRYSSTALFTDQDGTGVALGVQVRPSETGAINGYSRADAAMRQQAEAVLTTALNNKGADWAVEWEVDFGGSSIGLALWIAASADQQLRPDPQLAATGRIDASGHVCSVGGIAAKIRAAVMCGHRRILVPVDDYEQACSAVPADADVLIIGVRQVGELPRLLAEAASGATLGIHGAIRMIRKVLPLYGLDLTGEKQLENAYRLEVADASSRAYLDVFSGRRATVRPSGSGTALASMERLVAEWLARARVEPRPSWTVLVPVEARKQKLLRELEAAGAQRLPPTNQYELFRYRLQEGISSAVVIGYTSGKVQVAAGQAPAHDHASNLVKQALEGLGGLPPAPSSAARAKAEATATGSSELTPHIGTDEAGKGDYFGPLVCAACYLDAGTAEELRALGVRDSKTLSDRTIRVLAEKIRLRLPGRFAVVTLAPPRYNSLYAELQNEGKNLNSLVAWGHARGIQDLFERGVRVEFAIIDKFADEHYLNERLSNDTRRGNMRLEHRIKAESDIAVAAASILARDRFIGWLDEAASKLGSVLPKGAGPQVIAAGRTLVATRGASILSEYAKISFKTTRSILDQ